METAEGVIVPSDDPLNLGQTKKPTYANCSQEREGWRREVKDIILKDKKFNVAEDKKCTMMEG